jgi:ribosome-associated heat shock protein Hsp15
MAGLRADLLLHRLCMARSRTEAKQACDAGAVRRGDQLLKPSQVVLPGDRITVHYPHRLVEVEILEIPGRSVSRRAARELYRILREEKAAAETEETW